MKYLRLEYLVCIVVAALAVSSTRAATSVTVVANPGPFGSIEAAGSGEDRVDFFDGDLADDGACTESFAAVELQRFLAVCMGIPAGEIGLVRPDRLPDAGDVILLGTRASNPLIASLADSAGKTVAPDQPQSFRIRTLERDGRLITLIEGADRIGTLYGAYAYLERLGMRFYGLGEQGTCYPAPPVSLPRDLDLAESPAFITRGFFAGSPRGNETFFLWMARNRMNLWLASEEGIPLLRKLGLNLMEGGHGIQGEFLKPQGEYPYDHREFQGDEGKPPDPYAPGGEYLGDANKDGKLSYAEAHPEWYALRNGKRVARGGDPSRINYCTSNRDATHELAINLVRSLIDGDYRYADVLDLWMLDHGPWCECDACRRQGSETDRMLDIQHQVYGEIRKARDDGRLHREVRLFSLAYLETLPPPTKPLPPDFDYDHCLVTFFPISRCYAHPLADPACTEINRATYDLYRGWTMAPGGFYHGGLAVGEYYNVSSIKSLPVVYRRLLAADIPWYHRTGVRHLSYMHTPTSLWGTWTLNQHLLAKLLWNPDAEVEAILDDYFRRYYPTTTERTRRFYRELEYATANIKAVKHHVWTGTAYHCLPGKLDSQAKELFPMQHLRLEPYHPVINDAPDLVEIIEAMARARIEIDGALLACTDDVERRRLAEDERRFAYGEAMFLFLYHLSRNMIFHHRGDEALARREFEAVERQAERLRNVVDLVQVAFRHANAKNGLEASQADPAYEFLKERYGTQKGK